MVCSGNICRSPMAAGMLAQMLEEAGVAATVHSAGLLTEDRPASEHSVSLMVDRGVDLTAHRSRLVTAEHLSGADLVLCMERAHVRELTLVDGDAFARTFTLPELARRAEAAGPRRAGESVDQWLRRVGGDRRPADLVGQNPDDEVPDPYGGPRRAYRRTAARIEQLLRVVVDHLHPPGTAQG